MAFSGSIAWLMRSAATWAIQTLIGSAFLEETDSIMRNINVISATSVARRFPSSATNFNRLHFVTSSLPSLINFRVDRKTVSCGRPLKKSRSITGLLVSFASPILLQRTNNQLFIWFSRLFLLSSYSQMKGYAKDRRQTSHESVLRAL